MAVRFIASLFFVLLLSVPALAQNSSINFIKTSRFDVCRSVTVEELFRYAINRPVWEAGYSNAGEPLVEVTGTIGKGREMMSFYVQFEILPGKGKFKTNAMKVDGESLNAAERTEVFRTMCQ